MCSAEFAACWKCSKRTGHYKLKCDRVCSVITTKNRLLLLIFFFRKLVFLLILTAGLLWMKDSSLAFLGKTCSYPCRFFFVFMQYVLFCSGETSALETIFCGQFTLSTWIMKQNYLVYLWVCLSFLTVCALVYSETLFSFCLWQCLSVPFFCWSYCPLIFLFFCLSVLNLYCLLVCPLCLSLL